MKRRQPQTLGRLDGGRWADTGSGAHGGHHHQHQRQADDEDHPDREKQVAQLGQQHDLRAPRPNALRSECIRQPVERMGNQMEKIRLNHSSWRLWLAATYVR